MKYFEELKNAMNMLNKHENTIFIGQAVVYPGTGLYESLVDVSSEKKYEMPVAENLQMGISIGLALTGKIPISVYPRWNFLISATDQIVNHLDKISVISAGEYTPKVIIRVAIGSVYPLDPQDQHKGDFTDAFKLMCKNINIVRLFEPEEIVPAYEFALTSYKGSSILVEYSDFYQTK